MVEFNTRVIKSVFCDGRENIMIQEKTLQRVLRGGIKATEVYAPQNLMDFVSIFVSDEQAVENLKPYLTEERPIIFGLVDSLKSLYEHRTAYKGSLFVGSNWTGVVADLGNAWGVFVTNAYR